MEGTRRRRAPLGGRPRRRARLATVRVAPAALPPWC